MAYDFDTPAGRYKAATELSADEYNAQMEAHIAAQTDKDGIRKIKTGFGVLYKPPDGAAYNTREKAREVMGLKKRKRTKTAAAIPHQLLSRPNADELDRNAARLIKRLERRPRPGKVKRMREALVVALEALENLENDDGKAMPPSAWKMVQDAITVCRMGIKK